MPKASANKTSKPKVPKKKRSHSGNKALENLEKANDQNDIPGSISNVELNDANPASQEPPLTSESKISSLENQNSESALDQSKESENVESSKQSYDKDSKTDNETAELISKHSKFSAALTKSLLGMKSKGRLKKKRQASGPANLETPPNIDDFGHNSSNEFHSLPVKKGRSSFAASFYSARPISERSLRRSSGKVNYFEDEFKELDEEDDDSSVSPIRRKNRPVISQSENDQNVLEKVFKKAASSPRKRSRSSVDYTGDFTDGSQSGDERPRRHHMNNNMLLDSGALSTRIVFPMEVKAGAIQRILDGETKVQVARDLQCPVSTVASWWHRRTSIVPELASEVQSDSNLSSVSVFFRLIKIFEFIIIEILIRAYLR